MTNDELQIPATEIEISDAINFSESIVAGIIRKLAFERDRLKSDTDPPVCRLQFPDGTVPGNAREAAEGWKRLADEGTETVRRVWKALGISTYEAANGKTIWEFTEDLKRRADLWERLHDKARQQTPYERRKEDEHQRAEAAYDQSMNDLAASGGIFDAP